MSPAPSPLSLPDRASVGPQSWRQDAACRGADLSVFFSPDAERGHARARREARARTICAGCPVLTSCRAHALAAGEPYGVWGGLTELDRRHAARRRETPRRAGGRWRPDLAAQSMGGDRRG
ncbi:WhiB family transcriptional regulator [Rhodococcus koreensis]